ncbi:unnamed protein product [Cercopithifilaria johnstoni]|uniref:MAT1 C-terminal CAK anchor domain-containing protein n=1 Tax=Cercopithifilaria johnstoni TaxID=2874296 RepID=A0A8J2M1C0_9BILA|nr:unnamed protein product [Cercopithifilaria johnstoni]
MIRSNFGSFTVSGRLQFAKKEVARRKRFKMESEQIDKKEEKYLDESSFAAVRISGAPFVYRPSELLINGPPLPKPEDLSRMGYLQHMAQTNAEGCPDRSTPETCCMRALFDSRIDLFLL